MDTATITSTLNSVPVAIIDNGTEIGCVAGYGSTWYANTRAAGMLPGYFLSAGEAERAVRKVAA